MSSLLYKGKPISKDQLQLVMIPVRQTLNRLNAFIDPDQYQQVRAEIANRVAENNRPAGGAP